MPPLAHLAAINFFAGDLQGGLGPFLTTWLAQTGYWTPGGIGALSTGVGLATLFLNTPAGALVDHLHRPRLCIAIGCAAIIAGTTLILAKAGVWAIVVADFLAAAGGVLILPSLTALTLGIVGKDAFPRQQGRNQSFNHAGVLAAALAITVGTPWFGPSTSFWVLGGMAALALLAGMTTPGGTWDHRRAHGWEDKPVHEHRREKLLLLLGKQHLLSLALVLALFNVANGSIFGLLGQRLAANGYNSIVWTAVYLIVAEAIMIPVSLWAGSGCQRQGRRHLLLIATATLPVRAVMAAFVTDPVWLLPTEVLDGIGAGLIGVAVPVVVADVTWGSGRTQTALGAVNTLQGIGGVSSGIIGGGLVQWLGWTGGFLALAVPASVAFAIALWIEETRPERERRREAGSEPGRATA
ncbi:MAG: MFS transporter [Acetobacteraceae bacterium]|nr:MFS transporter [Acetobacteraceae bacterium]